MVMLPCCCNTPFTYNRPTALLDNVTVTCVHTPVVSAAGADKVCSTPLVRMTNFAWLVPSSGVKNMHLFVAAPKNQTGWFGAPPDHLIQAVTEISGRSDNDLSRMTHWLVPLKVRNPERVPSELIHVGLPWR